MGYNITVTDCTWTVPAANIDAAFLALISPYRVDGATAQLDGGSFINERYKWVGDLKEATTLADICEEFGFITYTDTNGDLIFETLESDKMGDEDQLLRALAPFSTGYITFVGEDGIVWQVTSRDGEYLEQSPVWPLDDDIAKGRIALAAFTELYDELDLANEAPYPWVSAAEFIATRVLDVMVTLLDMPVATWTVAEQDTWSEIGI